MADAIDALSPDDPTRPQRAAEQMMTMLAAGLVPDQRRIDRAIELGEIGLAAADPPDGFRESRALVHAFSLAWNALYGERRISPRAALAEMDRLAGEIAGREPFAEVLEGLRHNVMIMGAHEDHDLDAMRRATAGVGALFDGEPEPERAAFALMAEAYTAMLQDRWSDAWPLLDRLRQVLGELSDEPLRIELATFLSNADAQRALLDDTWTGGDQAGDVSHLAGALDDPGVPDAMRAFRYNQVGMALLHTDLDAAIEHLSRALELAPPRDPRQAHYLYCLGEALLTRSRAGGGRADLNAAITTLERSLAVAGSPAHRYWSTVSWALGVAYRLAGRNAEGRDVARRGLRGRAWSVMLQAGTPNATVAIRDAARHAADVARWHLDDLDADGAVRTLEAGRGLLLYTAMQTRNVPERLIARGEPALAEQWRQSAGDAPDDLRRRVLSVLAGVPFDSDDDPAVPGRHDVDPDDPAGLLDPPSLDEIRAALVASGSDALVYLVPGDPGEPGAAVVVPAAEPATWRWLPGLTAEFADEHAEVVWRDLEHQSHHPSTGDVCRWAWDTAVGPLLELLPPQPRLVLVPMGELAKVAWHAARTGAGDRDEYAVERAVFSYAASARLLCDVAWRPTAAGEGLVVGQGLVVGDPDTGGTATDLRGARAEAVAIHEEFYPDGPYVGRLADGTPAPAGAADRAGVLALLSAAPADSVLHLACHGVVRATTGDDDSSYLLLAGAERLAAEELIGTLNGNVTLAVLAACSSGASGRGYDEAFSIASALLASGVRSVVSALWSVPDDATSVLMFMLHWHLHQAGMRPREALRAAQHWMLDPAREIPAAMPPALRAAMSASDPADPAAWAGFVHQGR